MTSMHLISDNNINVNIQESRLQEDVNEQERDDHLDGVFRRQRHVEGEEECPHCLCAPCIMHKRYRQMWWWPITNAAVHRRNTSARKPVYRRFWAMLTNSGAWKDQRYLERKRQARGGDVTWHRWEIMPKCVVEKCREWFPNPDSAPYMGHMWD